MGGGGGGRSSGGRRVKGHTGRVDAAHLNGLLHCAQACAMYFKIAKGEFLIFPPQIHAQDSVNGYVN